MKINYFLLLVGLVFGTTLGKRKQTANFTAVYMDKGKGTPN